VSARRQSVLARYVFSLDHKVIGLQYLFASFAMLLAGGLLAMAMRWQLAWPWTEMPVVGKLLFPATGRVISPEFYTALFTMHGTIMVFFVVIPLLTGAFGNYLVPLMIGARDMAFPRLNMLSFWIFVPAALLVLASFFVEGGAAAAGWTSYAPLATLRVAAPGSGAGQTLWLVAVTLAGTSSFLGALNVVTTVVMMRAKGLTFGRLPLTVWGLLVASALQLLALPVLTAGGLLQLADRGLGTGFFTPANLIVNQVSPEAAGAAVGGLPILWQHLFWFYSHPAVYVMIVPAMGIISDVLAVHARKPVFGYRPMVIAMASIAGLGVIVWGHHMFVSGMNPTVGMAFMLSTVLIALPSGVKVFNWIATLWRSRIRLTAAMLHALGFVSLFIVGGLSGIWMAATPVDMYIHDTYVVVAHFHYIVFGGTMFAVFAGVHHWFPKMFGRMLDERLGKLHFVGTFVFTSGVFLMMHQLGFAGLMRRTADPYQYEVYAHLRPLNVFITWCAFALFAWQALFVVNLFWSLFRGVRVGRNPWQAASLEWEAPSPPAHGNFDRRIEVFGGPYEFGADARGRAGTSDFTPQTRKT
jgi:cytochrome c oxidase subunit I